MIIPVLLATEVSCGIKGKYVWKVYCPFCANNHIHGPIEGHRVAHCANENSNFRESGYIIMLPRKTSILTTRYANALRKRYAIKHV